MTSRMTLNRIVFSEVIYAYKCVQRNLKKNMKKLIAVYIKNPKRQHVYLF